MRIWPLFLTIPYHDGAIFGLTNAPTMTQRYSEKKIFSQWFPSECLHRSLKRRTDHVGLFPCPIAELVRRNRRPEQLVKKSRRFASDTRSQMRSLDDPCASDSECVRGVVVLSGCVRNCLKWDPFAYNFRLSRRGH